MRSAASLAPCWCFLAALGLAAFGPAQAPAQEVPPSVRLGGVLPGGVRSTTTDAWTTFDFEVTNLTDADRHARVMVFFPERPDAQYGRDVWVPGRSMLRSWMLVGPAPAPVTGRTNEVQMLLYDRPEGKGQLVLPRADEGRVRSRIVRHRARETFTAVVLDELAPDPPYFGRLPLPESRGSETVRLVRTFRQVLYLSEVFTQLTAGTLPATADGYDGLDHLIIASDRAATDPAGLRAARQWLARGGKVWVLLDQVDLDTVAPLLGDAIDFHIVDRVSLTSLQVKTHAPGLPAAVESGQAHERPVDFVRVVLPAHERPRHTIDGWPTWFSRRVGQGTVVFTTLGPRGWYRPRGPRDPKSPYEQFPDLPMSTFPLDVVATVLHAGRDDVAFRPAAFQRSLTEEIGYSVVGQGTAGLVFTLFVLGTLGLGLTLRHSRRPELVGWLAPAAALLAAGVFIVLGERSRRAAVPTVAAGQIVEPLPGTAEAAVQGLLAVYRPDSGSVPASGRGGMLDLDLKGLEGQTRRFVLDDIDSWRLEGLALPAGVRLAPFRATLPTGTPITAVARPGPTGLEGKLEAGPFRDVEDAVLSTPAGRRLTVRIGPDGAFRTASEDALPAGEFLTGAILSDRQQRRQELYREFLKRPLPPHLEGRTVLFAWASPVEANFTLGDEVRRAGAALLVVPLRLEPPAAGTAVTVPGPLLAVQRILEGRPVRLPSESRQATDLHLRFQLPRELLPFAVERARLSARFETPSRRVRVASETAAGRAEVHRVDSPLDPIRIDLSGKTLPRQDEDGGLHLHVSVSELLGAATERDTVQRAETWKMHYIELEVVGRAR